MTNLDDILIEHARREQEHEDSDRYLMEMTLFPGEYMEYETRIPKPLGKDWIKRYGPIGQFVLGFANKMLDKEIIGDDLEEIDLSKIGVDPESFFKAMGEYFGSERLIEDYVAPVLGMDTPEGHRYINTFFGPGEMIRYFLPAAQAIISDFRADDAEVVEAQKKSPAPKSRKKAT